MVGSWSFILRSRTGAGHAIGILTHHLDHDPTVWETLTAILATTGGHPGARWTTPHELAMQGGGS